MIRDYKFDAGTAAHKRRKARNRRLVLVATMLISTLAIARLVNLAEGHVEEAPLPTKDTQATLQSELPATSENEESHSMPGNPSVKTKILAIPKQAADAAFERTRTSPRATPNRVTTPVGPSLTAIESSFAVKSNLTADPDMNVSPASASTKLPAAGKPRALMAEPARKEHRWVEHKIKKGDTLAAIFKSFDLSPALLHKIVNSGKKAAGLSRIRPQQIIRFKISDQNELLELMLERDRLNSLHIKPRDDTFEAYDERKDAERRIKTASGVIESSLFVDGQRAGLNDGQIMDLAGIFGWDIDFALEIRAGDQFNLIYEELYLDGEKFDNGNILAAEFVNRGTRYRAIRYVSPGDEVAYFDADGHNKKRAFIRTPVKFGRISSRFTNRRWHPILKRWRSHKGVDYAAPTGTPIRATGAGRITFKGRKSGYGRVVFIEHAGKYTTVYGHMSRFARKIKTGTRVKQGQLIGYVGKSGLATGPHLHYEFRVAGVHRNPLRVKFPKSLPLPKKLLPDFRQQAAPMLAKLDAMSDDTLIATAPKN